MRTKSCKTKFYSHFRNTYLIEDDKNINKITIEEDRIDCSTT